MCEKLFNLTDNYKFKLKGGSIVSANKDSKEFNTQYGEDVRKWMLYAADGKINENKLPEKHLDNMW